MSFKTLKNEELEKVAEFFLKDVTAVDPEKPTKKELVAALASGDPDDPEDAPVTWDDYQNIFLPAQEDSKPKDLPSTDLAKLPEPTKSEESEPAKPKDSVVMFTGKNPRFDMAGVTVTKDHPFASVDEDKAAYLVKNGPFRPALPSEVTDWYN